MSNCLSAIVIPLKEWADSYNRFSLYSSQQPVLIKMLEQILWLVYIMAATRHKNGQSVWLKLMIHFVEIPN